MHDGRWTMRSCPPEEAAALARELEIAEITASVLSGAGSATRTSPRAFLAGERAPHDPLLLGDMAVAVERIRAAIAAGRRSACTATTTSTGSAPPRSPS